MLLLHPPLPPRVSTSAPDPEAVRLAMVPSQTSFGVQYDIAYGTALFSLFFTIHSPSVSAARNGQPSLASAVANANRCEGETEAKGLELDE